ncbi:MAG: hypothetical protein R2712_29440 [Vicinamibacterales bacterium]
MPPAAPREHDPRITVIQQELFDERRSKVDKYRELVVGRPGLWPLVRYELVTLLASWVPGALGLFLRSKLYPLVLGRVGRNVVFGTNVTLRHPHKIVIGDNVVIDDQCCLDAKGTDNRGIDIGSGVFVGRNTILSCKNGDIVIEDHANLGFNCEIFSASRVRVGKSILMAAYACLVGGDHLCDRWTSGAGADRTARHRRWRRRVARDARRSDRWGHHRSGHHRRRRGRRRTGAGNAIAAGIPASGHARPARRRRRCAGRGGRGTGVLTCGIASASSNRGPRASAAGRLQHMVRTLVHRGPDEEGSITLPGVWLPRHARLSIVDLSGGQQPFTNETRRHPPGRQRQDLQLSRASARAGDLGHTFRSGDIGCSCTATSSGAPTCCRASAGCSPLRCGTRTHPNAGSGARSGRRSRSAEPDAEGACGWRPR